jgi:hypothetical protein
MKNLTYIPVMEEPVHTTPCQLSPHGSPPFPVHPGRSGDPSDMYSPFMAETTDDKRSVKKQSALSIKEDFALAKNLNSII